MIFKIAHLYPKELNLYGDVGNVLYLRYFLSTFKIESTLTKINKGDKVNEDFDFIFSGGGPDSLQSSIYQDFLSKKSFLVKHIEANKPSVFICGSYQLLGKYYLLSSGKKISGLGIFNFYTESPSNQKQRIVGNTYFNFKPSNFSTKVVGFENHNGRTYLNEGVNPLGLTYSKKSGNNDLDFTEGVLYKRTLGTYLHGPLFVKNPNILFYLLKNYITSKNAIDLKSFYSEFIAHQNVINSKF